MKISRIEGLADGIFAFAMTLLVLDLHVPAVGNNLRADVMALWPRLLSLIISFVILAIYWGAQHMLLARLKEISFAFMWRNIYFLLPVSLVPFTTSLLGQYPLSHTAQTVYAINLALCGLLIYGAIHYALKRPNFFITYPTLEFKRNVATKILLPVVMYILALPATFINPHLGLIFLAAGPLIYFTPIDTRTWNLLVKPTDWAYKLITGKQPIKET
jgi:uncharacterized membrane protein